MHKSIYNTIVHVACFLCRSSYTFITKNTTISKKSISEYSLSCVSPQGAELPAPAPHPPRSCSSRAQLHLNLPMQRCSAYSLASKGSRSYNSHFLSSICTTSLLVIPIFYTLSQGAAAFAAILRGKTHEAQESLLLPYCKAQRDTLK